MQCPYCKSSNVVKPNVAADQGSSSHLGFGISSGGMGIGIGTSKTKEARKARDLASKEFYENAGADESLAQKIGVSLFFLFLSLMYYLIFWIIGYNWEGYGDSFLLSVFVLSIYVIFPIVPSVFLAAFITKILERKGDKWSKIMKNSVSYYMCRSCGQNFKI